ncbi:hypothetical protein [Pararhizobium sp. DWP3-4]|uniref:hypothetical protein n=1 Tax=Pararhizobium sp. DWP3-4 TaxID=2804565 RepID=UPI003CF3E121
MGHSTWQGGGKDMLQASGYRPLACTDFPPNKGQGRAVTFVSTTIAHPQHLVYPKNNKIKTVLQIDYEDKISSFCHKFDGFLA